MSSTLFVIDDPRSLIGTWEFARTIADHRAGQGYRVTGRAVLEAVDDTIRWHEDGLLWRDGEYPVMRTLLLRQGSMSEPRWHVEFDDGRPFHDWELDTPLVHLCGADLYSGQVIMPDADSWHIEWNVSGPTKDYALTTRYRRLGMPEVEA